jgi:3-oxoacyl-[acyl-carrier protein] reductase
VGNYGIRVYCIALETILTERNEELIPQDQKKALLEVRPIKRLGNPNDVAQAAFYLVSDNAAWVSGIILDVAGGSVLT